jgi:hypothetical protein
MADERAPVLQWVGLFLAPAAFFAHLQVNYVLVPWACTTGLRIWIHIVSLTALVLALAGALAGWRVHERAESDAPNDNAGAVPRMRFLGVVGLCASAIFALLLAAQLVAGIIISPCQ